MSTLAVAAALAIGASACATFGSDSTSRPPDPAIDVSGDPALISGAADDLADHAADITSVVMIGDSITKGSTPALENRYGLLGLEHLIEAENAKRMAVSANDNPSGASVAEFLAGTNDDHGNEVWVVALGTNDIGQYAGADEIAAAVNQVLAEVPDQVPLVWVDTYYRDRADDGDAVNTIIRERVTRRGNSVIAPWAAFAADDGVLSFDGVHPTTDGTDVFAFVVTDTVRAFLGR